MFQPVLAFRLLSLDNDVWRVGRVLLDHHDVRPFLVDGGAKVNFLLDPQAVFRIAVMVDQFLNVELADNLFGFGRAIFLRHPALEVRFAALVEDFESLDLVIGKDREGVFCTFQNGRI